MRVRCPQCHNRIELVDDHHLTLFLENPVIRQLSLRSGVGNGLSSKV